MTTQQHAGTFFGWRVVGGAFVLAVFGWGTGFYGPPVFLSVLHETRGWPVSLISAAITLHFLTGAIAGANLPAIHRRLGSRRRPNYVHSRWRRDWSVGR